MGWNKKIEVGGTASPSSAYVTDTFDGGKDFNYMAQFDYEWWGTSSRKNILHIDLIDTNGSTVIETKNIECAPDSSATKYKVFFTCPKPSYYVLKFRVSCSSSGTKCNVYGGVYVS